MKLATFSLVAVISAPLTLTPAQQMEIESYVFAELVQVMDEDHVQFRGQVIEV